MKLLQFLTIVALAPSVAFAAEPLTLERAISLALTRNERALVAKERVAVAEARLSKARSFFYPDLNLTGTYTKAPPVTRDGLTVRSGDSLIGTASIGVTLFDGRVFPLWRAAAREAEASSLDARNEARVVAFEAADAFLRTLGSQQVALAAERRLALSRRSLEEAQVRFQAQLVSSNDVTRAEVEVAEAEQSATRTKGDADTSRLQLAFLIVEDEDLSPLLDMPAPIEKTPTAPPESLARQAQDNRPDVAAAKKRVESADALAQEPLWRFVPSLNVGAQYSVSNNATAFSPQNDWRALATLNWSLFDAERLADRQEQLAFARAAKLEAAALERSARNEVARALVSLNVADATVKQAEVGATVARRNAEETNVLYREGLARALEVADANQRLFEAEVALAQEKYARGAAWLNLRAALGLDPLGRELQE